MDQLTAHLDRGWDLAQSGDARGAESSARRALELAPDSPEAFNLLGYVASLEGDTDEAIEAYQQAIALDDGYVEAMLNAAELCVHPLADFEQAIDLCERVLDISEFDDEILDALLLKFDAHFGMNDDDEARKVLLRLPTGPFESAMHNLLAGRAHFELGETARARPLLDAALASEPGNPEISYYAGLLAEAEGNHQEASMLFLRVRQIECDAELPPWAPNEQAFMAFVEQAVAALPAELGKLMTQAEVYVVDMPGPEMLVDGIDVHAMALVDVLGADRETGDSSSPAGAPALLATSRLRVFLYAVNLLRQAGSLPAVEPAIREALERELRQLQDEGRDPGVSN